MSVLTALGLMLDIVGAFFITISDPPMDHSQILRARYWLDEKFPPVSLVKNGYSRAMSGAIYTSKERQRAEEVDPDLDSLKAVIDSTERLGETEVNPKLVKKLDKIYGMIGREKDLLTYSSPPTRSPSSPTYKVTHAKREGVDFAEGPALVFKNHSTDEWPGSLFDGDVFYHYIGAEVFESHLLEYINGVYLRTGMYLLMVGFCLQTVDVLIPAATRLFW